MYSHGTPEPDDDAREVEPGFIDDPELASPHVYDPNAPLYDGPSED